MTDGDISFDEWVRHCFERATLHFTDQTDRDLQIDCLEPSICVKFVIRLFEAPSFLMERYSNDQIAAGLYHIFDAGRGEYFCLENVAAVPEEEQVRMVLAMKNLYSDLFDRLYSDGSARGQENRLNSDKFDGVVQMLWDICPLTCAFTSQEYKHLVEPIFQVLEAAMESPNSSCIVSALQGFDDASCSHPERVQRFLDAFLQRNSDPDYWLRAHAEPILESAKRAANRKSRGRNY